MNILVFIYGLLLASFYNVVGLRIPLKKSIIKPRSACPYCGHQLSAKELMPVLSFVIQRGKCVSCSGRISLLYPIMELITGTFFVLAYQVFGLQLELIVALTLISLFSIITVSDIKYMIIPDKVLLFFAALFIVERLFVPLSPWWGSLTGAALGFTLLLFIAIVSRGGMGGGDIKLFALIGFVLGVKGLLLSFFLATLLGAVVGILGMLLGKFKKGEAIAFGPYICLGTILAYFFGEKIIQWYFSLYI
jgi:leader peptidase (prepilin peptidase) / N-methyltransferase